jgi:hypothetical protein
MNPDPDYAYGTWKARTQINVRKGPTITIDCGDLPEVPDWLVKELDAIKERLDRDIAAEHAKAAKAAAH